MAVEEGMKLREEFPFNLRDLLLTEKQIEDKHLVFLGEIKTRYIKKDNKKLENFLNMIKCNIWRLEDDLDDKVHVWVMFGNGEKEKRWLPLQVASITSEDSSIFSEIQCDLYRMFTFKRDLKSFYHGVIMEVEEGRDVDCQKYSALRKKCASIAIAVLNMKPKSMPKSLKKYGLSSYQLQEIQLANELKPLIWNPNIKEQGYAQELRNQKKGM